MIQKDVFVSSNLVDTFEDISTTLVSYPFWAYMHSVLVNLGIFDYFWSFLFTNGKTWMVSMDGEKYR